MMVKNNKWKFWAALCLVLPLLFATLQVRAAEVPGGHSGQVSPDGGEYADPEDIDLRLEYAGLLTEEQMAALEEAYALLKAGVSAAEDVYLEAIKPLKDRYRTAARDAVKSTGDGAELAAFLEKLKEDILAEYETVQRALDDEASAARLAFKENADLALIPEEITAQLIGWHENKELNAANELIHFIESYRNLPGQDSGSQHGNQTQNSEQNREENQNQGEQQNQEQEKQQEQNDQGNSGQQKTQPQGNLSGGKGKGGN